MTPETKTVPRATDRLCRFVEILMRAVRTGSLYSADHPRRREAIGVVREMLRGVADESGTLSLAVSPSGLQIQGVALATEEAQELARRLSVGGLVYLELHEEIADEELGELASILALDLENLRLEDDLATLLWERQSPHIKWEAVEVPSAPIEDEPSTFNSALPEGDWPDPLCPSDTAARDFQLTTEEEQALQAQIAAATGELGRVDTASLLCQLIGLQHQREHVSQTLELLRSLVDLCLREGRFAEAGAILQRLDQFPLDPKWTTDEKLRAITEWQQEFASGESIGQLVSMLESGSWDSEDAAVGYLTSLHASATSPLLEALLALRNDRARGLVRKGLAHHLRDDLTLVRDALLNAGGDVQLELVRLLREIGTRDIVGILKDVVPRAADEVRLEIIETLQAIEGAHSRAVLARLLTDPNPEIRARAARALPLVGAREALEPLLKTMLTEEFRKRPLVERVEFFRSIGTTNIPEVLPLLRRLLVQRGWRRRRIEEDRHCASAALSVMTHPEAIAVRNHLMQSGPRAVQKMLAAATSRGGTP